MLKKILHTKQALIEINKKYNTTQKNDIYQKMLEICRIYYENQHMMKVYMEMNQWGTAHTSCAPTINTEHIKMLPFLVGI